MDAYLIQGIQQNDERIFSLVYDLYHNKLYYYILKKIASPEASAELVQTVFIKCWRYRNSLSVDISLSNQIFRIAKTSVIDLLRKKASEKLVSIDDCENISSLPVENEIAHPQLDEVKATLKLISPQRRKIVECRLEGLSNNEIAQRLSISKKTVENQLNRAVKEIRNHVSEVSIYTFPFFLIGLIFKHY